MSAAQLIAVPISTLVPFVAYYVIYRLVAEPGASIRVVGLCILWGAGARLLFFLAVVIAAIPDASVQLAAPIIGEILVSSSGVNLRPAELLIQCGHMKGETLMDAGPPFHRL